MISCVHYDYIEIACTYKLSISLKLKSGDVLEGKALDTQYNENKEECIKLLAEKHEILIVLNLVESMKAIEKNPHFSRVTFD